MLKVWDLYLFDQVNVSDEDASSVQVPEYPEPVSLQSVVVVQLNVLDVLGEHRPVPPEPVRLHLGQVTPLLETILKTFARLQINMTPQSLHTLHSRPFRLPYSVSIKGGGPSTAPQNTAAYLLLACCNVVCPVLCSQTGTADTNNAIVPSKELCTHRWISI